MSHVFSFRLSEENAREKRALLLLETKMKEGISIRSLITDSLLDLLNTEPQPKNTEIDEMYLIVKKILHTLELGNLKINNLPDQMDGKVTEEFINAIKRDIKNGISLP